MLLYKKTKATGYEKLTDIGKIADKIDQVVLRSLLFIHAFSSLWKRENEYCTVTAEEPGSPRSLQYFHELKCNKGRS